MPIEAGFSRCDVLRLYANQAGGAKPTRALAACVSATPARFYDKRAKVLATRELSPAGATCLNFQACLNFQDRT